MGTKVQPLKFAADVQTALAGKGAFLNTRADGVSDSMTIGWGGIMNIWGKPVFMAMVRYSRYSYELIEKSGVFTVSVPMGKDFSKELAYCGTVSGRDEDKLAKLRIAEAKEIDCPLIADCGLQLECRVVYQQSMEPSLIFSDGVSSHYRDRDYHVLYFGEILSAELD